MYRQYENPNKLEEQLAELKARRAVTTDEYELMGIDEDIHDLKCRINFAYQDEEYDENY